MAQRRYILPFNTALETGLRALSIIVAAYPRAFDLQRLVVYDHLVVHTADIGGPASLHPEVPMRSAALLVRRPIVERGLLLMMSRGLVERYLGSNGITYTSGEFAEVFMNSLESLYVCALKEKARWVVNEFAELDDADLRALMREKFGTWMEEFDGARMRSAGNP